MKKINLILLFGLFFLLFSCATPSQPKKSPKIPDCQESYQKGLWEGRDEGLKIGRKTGQRGCDEHIEILEKKIKEMKKEIERLQWTK